MFMLIVQAALAHLNAAIDGDDADALLAALRDPVLELVDVDEAGAVQYHLQLKALKAEKQSPVCTGFEPRTSRVWLACLSTRLGFHIHTHTHICICIYLSFCSHSHLLLRVSDA